MITQIFTIVTILLVLTAIFSYINVRFIKLPTTIAVTLMSLVASMFIVVLGSFYPETLRRPAAFVSSIEFETVLMRVLLSFLLFAGAVHIDINRLKKHIGPIATYATVGVLFSTAIIGFSMQFIFQLFDIEMPLIYCLLFGALISPTDPIAVLGILKKAGIPKSIETKITGESLFNDGVGVVIFISLLQIAQAGTDSFSGWQITTLFLQEALGGLVWGVILGYGGYLLMRSIDHYQTEVLISLAIVMGGYLLASALHISGPLAMVAAGIIVGNKGKNDAMSDITKDYVNKFWELLDEILNAILFLLIGLEMIIISFDNRLIWLGLIGILVVLLSRFISVTVPTLIWSMRHTFEKNILPILTWGGLRGGISIALALSLPKGEYRDIIVSITYVIVIFSILVQGLTIGPLAKRLTVNKGNISTPTDQH